MTRFTLDAPAWLLLVLVPLLIALLAWLRRGRDHGVPYACWDVAARAPHTWRERLRHLPAVLRGVALALLAVALSGPSSIARRLTAETPGLAVMLVIDVSGSMLAMDIAPDRIGAARRVAAAVMAQRPDDRFGIMAFAGRTVTLCPVTSDRAALTAGLQDARAGTTELDEGTALGAALARAVEWLDVARRGTGGGGVILLLSDGASNEGEVAPLEAAALAARHEVRVDAIGLGGNGATRYPTEVGVLDVRLPVQEGILRRITAITGGRYVRASDDAALAGFVASLDGEMRPAPVQRERVDRRPIAGRLVCVVMVCLLAEVALASGALRVARG